MITDADIERIVPGKTKVNTGTCHLSILHKFQHQGEWYLVNRHSVWGPNEYEDWTLVDPILDLSKLEPGKTILKRPDDWYHLFLGRVENEGIYATGGLDDSGRLHHLSAETVRYFPYAKCKTWTIVEGEE